MKVSLVSSKFILVENQQNETFLQEVEGEKCNYSSQKSFFYFAFYHLREDLRCSCFELKNCCLDFLLFGVLEKVKEEKVSSRIQW